jgi:hypothetical protein
MQHHNKSYLFLNDYINLPDIAIDCVTNLSYHQWRGFKFLAEHLKPSKKMQWYYFGLNQDRFSQRGISPNVIITERSVLFIKTAP